MSKLYRSTLLPLALGVHLFAGLGFPEATEIQQASKVMQAAADRFLSLMEEIDEEQWDARAAGIRHSIGEEAEHTALAHQELQTQVVKALRAPAQPERAKELEGKEVQLRRLMLQATTRAEAYPPRQKLKTKAEVLEFFNAAHRKAMQKLQGGGSALEVHVFKHPSRKYGELTALQWFYYIAYHNMRHCQVIETILGNTESAGE